MYSSPERGTVIMTNQPSKGYYKHPNETLHEKLAETHDRLVAVEVAMRDNVDPGLARLAAELESLRGLMEKGYNNPEHIMSVLNGIERGIADHEIRISGLEAGFVVLESETARAHARVTRVEEVVAEDREVNRSTARRVDVLEDEVHQGFPFFGASLALIVGVLAGWLWHRHDFNSSVKVTGGMNRVTATSAADLLICAILFGIGAGLAVMALVALFNRARYRARVEEASIRREANDVFNRRTSVRTDQALDTPPTELLPTQPVAQNS